MSGRERPILRRVRQKHRSFCRLLAVKQNNKTK